MGDNFAYNDASLPYSRNIPRTLSNTNETLLAENREES